MHRKASWPMLAAICVCGAIGELVLYIGPVLVGVSVDGLAFATGDAGYVVAAEFGCSAFGAVFIAARKRMTHLRAIAALSIAVLIACDGLSYTTTSQAVFVACRVTAALCAGILFAIGNAVAASLTNSHRTFSMMLLVTLGFAAIVFLMGPTSVLHFGPRGPLLILVLISATGFGFLLFLPSELNKAADVPNSTEQLTAGASLIILSIFLLYACQSGLWAYAERIGQSNGLDSQQIALVLTVNAAAIFLAALLSRTYGLRSGFGRPVLLAISIMMVSAVALPHLTSPLLYGASVIGLTAGLTFVVPFLKSLTSAFDESGRLASIATGAITLGSAAGPAATGFALNKGAGFAAAAMVSATGLGLAVIAALLSQRLRHGAGSDISSRI